MVRLMKHAQSQYTEKFPEEFSIRQKISDRTEKKNFHLHKQLEIVFALSGNLKCKFETGTVDIPKNGMILIHQMDLHYIYSEEGSGMCHRYVLYFSPEFIHYYSTPEINLLECFFVRPDQRPVILAVSDAQLESFLSVLRDMEQWYEDGAILSADCAKNLYLKFRLGEFLLLTNYLYQEQIGLYESIRCEEQIQLIYDIYEYINQHYHMDLSLDMLSQQFLISKTQLYYLFRSSAGMTVSCYITQLRMTKAKDFLINTDYSVEMISQAVGYENISSFSRTFKKKTGYSPVQYRKKYG